MAIKDDNPRDDDDFEEIEIFEDDDDEPMTLEDLDAELEADGSIRKPDALPSMPERTVEAPRPLPSILAGPTSKDGDKDDSPEPGPTPAPAEEKPRGSVASAVTYEAPEENTTEESGKSSGCIVFAILALLLLAVVGGGAVVFVMSMQEESPQTGPAQGSAPAPVPVVTPDPRPTPLSPAVKPQPQTQPAPVVRTTPANPVPQGSAALIESNEYDGPTIEIGIAYGTEKKKWLKWAHNEFRKTVDGQKIKVRLIPKGSREGAQEVLQENKAVHVWSPASALFRDYFETEYRIKYGTDPIVHGESLALTPMVFVFWEERWSAFNDKYSETTFTTLGKALGIPEGWREIGNKPEWGLFKFGHTHPAKSNSGSTTLILMAYAYHKKTRGLTVAEITDPGFQNWLKRFESAVTGLSHSTGTMMREMILKGPSAYDGLCVYENLAIDYLKNAEGRWGKLRVVYPRKTMWNDNPYYILNVPWSTQNHKDAARAFLNFLMSRPIQARSLEHGFRPGNPDVPVKFAESPFVRYKAYGLQLEVPDTCEPPRGDVIENLLQSWQRVQGNR